MHYLTTRHFPCIVASLFATAALAEDPVQEDSYLTDLPVVLSASRLSQALSDAPGAVTVIDREMIRASGARDVFELFRLVPGFQVGTKSGGRPQPMVAYHGLSDDAPRRMLVQIDGRSAYSPYFTAGVEWDQLGVDLDDIERIEVFRGSNAAAYGSNAFMGIANIITRPAADTRGVAFRQRTGEDGIADTRLRLGRQLGPVDMRMTFSRSRDNGVPDQNNSHRNDMANLRADWQISAEQQLEFQAGWQDNLVGKGKLGELVEPPRNTSLTQSFGLLRWRRAAAPGEEQSLTYYHQEESSRDLVSFVAPVQAYGYQFSIPGQIDYGFETVRDDIEFQQTTTAASNLRLIWGAGARADQLRAPQYFNTNDTIRTSILRLFGNAEWRASQRWLFNAGAMLDRNSLTGTALAPRASANYHMTEAHTFRLVASRSHRAPVAFEQKADMIVTNSATVVSPFGIFPPGTPLVQIYHPASNLGAEHVNTLEVGYLGEFREINSTVEVRAYRERLRNLIEMSTEQQGVGAILQKESNFPSAKYYANTGEADVRGVETSATWRPSLRTWLTLNHAIEHIEGPKLTAAQQLTQPSAYVATSAPRRSTTLTGAWSINDDWQASFAHHWIGSMSWYQDMDYAIPFHRRLDLRIARRFNVANTRGELSLVGQNVDGADTPPNNPIYVDPKRIFAVLSLEL